MYILVSGTRRIVANIVGQEISALIYYQFRPLKITIPLIYVISSSRNIIRFMFFVLTKFILSSHSLRVIVSWHNTVTRFDTYGASFSTFQELRAE